MVIPEEKKGSVELIFLTMLQDETRHGYDIARVAERRSAGKLEYPPSTSYSAHYRMDNRG